MLDSNFLAQFRAKGDPFHSLLARSTFLGKYKRDVDQSWTDTIARVVIGSLALDPRATKQEAEQLFEMFWNCWALPPGRGLWTGGVKGMPVSALYNCFGITIRSIDDWCWTADMLMHGGGVGVSLLEIGCLPPVANGTPHLHILCSKSHPNREEVLPDDPHEPVYQYLVEDSRQGWVESLRLTLSHAFEGKPLALNVSSVRPRGAPIKTFGGVACGPAPLAQMCRAVWSVVRKRAGKSLTSVDALDITNHIGVCIKSGNVRRCLPGDTLVHTQEGLIPIRDVREGMKVRTATGYQRVLAHLDQGEQSVIDVHTQMGHFRCTSNHRVAVLDTPATYTFKEAGDLKSGDRMVFVDHVLPGTPTKLPEWHYDRPVGSTTCKDISIPELDTDMAWFLGYLLGNGYVMARRHENGYNASVSICLPNNDYHDALATRVRTGFARFGINTQEVEPSPKDNSRKIRTSSKQLAWYLDENFKQPNTDIHVPECILRSLPEIRSAFLAGVFDSDGSAGNRPVLLCSSIYKIFVDELQSLYASLGIATRVKLNREASGTWKAVHHLVLVGERHHSRYVSLIQPYSVKEIPVRTTAQYDYGFPTEMVLRALPHKTWNRKWTSQCKQMVEKLYSNLGGDCHTPVAVIEVNHSNEVVDTFDIEVENDNEFVANGLLVHNSALLILGEATDQPFRDSKKSWTEILSHRSTSNNSIVFRNEQQIDEFDWKALVEDNSVYGEPGILNLWKGRQTDPSVEIVNPCYRANTRIHTRQGHYEIRDLVGKVVEVWDGKSWRCVETFQKTSENEPMLKFTLRDGSVFAVTEYHIIVTADGRRLEAKDVKVGERLLISNAPPSHGNREEWGAYAKGFCIGDGTASKDREDPMLWLYTPKVMCIPRLEASINAIPIEQNLRSDCKTEAKAVLEPNGKRHYFQGISARTEELLPWCREYKRSLPKHAFRWCYAAKCDFIAGVMDADGTASDTSNGFMYQICSVERQFLLDFQELLKTIGVYSNLALMKKAGTVDFHDGYGSYKTLDCWRLTISQSSSITLARQVTFSRLKSFANKTTSYSCGPRFNTVVAIEPDGTDSEVYCLVAEDPDQIACSNGLIIGRCGEILLENRGACCLSEIYPAKFPARYASTALKLITRYTLRQRLQTMEDPKADRIRRLHMRLGVGLGGICDFGWHPGDLQYAYEAVKDTAYRYADELDVVQPIALTTVKPSGTIGLLAESSPGIHAPFAPFYIRRTRIAKNEPMAQALMEAGVPHEACVYDSTGHTLVFSFPMKSNAAVTVQNQTVRDQIERQVIVQKYWADNAVSSTISFAEHEKEELAELLKKHAKDLKSISCLPTNHKYTQPPYESISRDEYTKLHMAIDHNHPLTEGGDLEIDECAGGICPVK